MKRIGVAIAFEPGVTLEQVEQWIAEYRNAGVIDTAEVGQYEDHGGSCGPVFYIP